MALEAAATPGYLQLSGRGCGHGGATDRKSSLRLAGIERRPHGQCRAGGKSGLLCDVGDPGIGAAVEGWSGRSKTGNHLGFEVRRLRRG